MQQSDIDAIISAVTTLIPPPQGQSHTVVPSTVRVQVAGDTVLPFTVSDEDLKYLTPQQIAQRIFESYQIATQVGASQ